MMSLAVIQDPRDTNPPIDLMFVASGLIMYSYSSVNKLVLELFGEGTSRMSALFVRCPVN